MVALPLAMERVPASDALVLRVEEDEAALVAEGARLVGADGV
jgi:hypothetical protein